MEFFKAITFSSYDKSVKTFEELQIAFHIINSC